VTPAPVLTGTQRTRFTEFKPGRADGLQAVTAWAIYRFWPGQMCQFLVVAAALIPRISVV
jgi:hypothetical protein